MSHDMAHDLADNNGARVSVRLDQSRPIGAYTVHVADGSPVGRADFVDSPEVDDERILFHTEIDHEHAGRGLAGVLVREVLADSIRHGLTVVPVCPLIALHLEKHGDEFLAEGGRFRTPTKADIALVMREARVRDDA
jgi:predicted GNAT family acetyltransferase